MSWSETFLYENIFLTQRSHAPSKQLTDKHDNTNSTQHSSCCVQKEPIESRQSQIWNLFSAHLTCQTREEKCFQYTCSLYVKHTGEGKRERKRERKRSGRAGEGRSDTKTKNDWQWGWYKVGKRKWRVWAGSIKSRRLCVAVTERDTGWTRCSLGSIP